VLDSRGLSVVLLVVLSMVTAAVHEGWHWLAARALGLSARFGVDRRLYFLVFETDLSQLWSVPRRRRYGPLLAGLAIDSVLLALALGVQLAGGRWPPPVSRLAAALVWLLTVRFVWQCLVFLRTDLYAVFVTATGCRDLWQVKTLLLRQAFGRLTDPDATRLARADPRDIRVGRWFRWLHLAGLLGCAGYFWVFYRPIIAELTRWTAGGLAVGPVHPSFWGVLAVSGVVYLPAGLVLGLAARQAAVSAPWVRAVAGPGVGRGAHRRPPGALAPVPTGAVPARDPDARGRPPRAGRPAG
jgi:hypothetical protein